MSTQTIVIGYRPDGETSKCICHPENVPYHQHLMSLHGFYATTEDAHKVYRQQRLYRLAKEARNLVRTTNPNTVKWCMAAKWSQRLSRALWIADEDAGQLSAPLYPRLPMA